MQYEIGDELTDESGRYKGRVCIVWNDGDICTIENDAAHPNPRRRSSRRSRVAKRGASKQTQGYIKAIKNSSKELRKPPPAYLNVRFLGG